MLPGHGREQFIYDPSVVVVGIGLAVCAVMAWTIRALMRDHYKNLVGSYEFLKKNERRAGDS